MELMGIYSTELGFRLAFEDVGVDWNVGLSIEICYNCEIVRLSTPTCVILVLDKGAD